MGNDVMKLKPNVVTFLIELYRFYSVEDVSFD